MKTLGTIVVMFALVMACPRSSAAMDPGKSVGTISAAELERNGDRARMEKDYPLAVENYQAALRKEPNNPTLHNKLGLAIWRNGDSRKARMEFQRATKLDSKFAEAFNNMGAVDFTEKRLSSAAKYFKKAVALDETRATFHVNLGAAWFAQDKIDRAVKEYTRALELDPDSLTNNAKAGVMAQIASPEERAHYSYMLAKIYARRGDVDNCLRCLQRAKEEGFHEMANVYKDEEFARLRQDARLMQVVPPPAK